MAIISLIVFMKINLKKLLIFAKITFPLDFRIRNENIAKKYISVDFLA
jgi:hypothetical protein